MRHLVLILCVGVGVMFGLPCLSMAQEISYDCLQRSAKQHIEATQYSKAVDMYQQALLLAPNTEAMHSVRKRLLEACILAKRYSEGIELFAGTSPNDPEILYGLGVALHNSGDHEKAIEVLKAYLLLEETDKREACQVLGSAYFLSGHLDDARNCFEKQNSDQSLFALARINLAQGRGKEAEMILDALGKRLAPDTILRFDLAYLRGEMCFQNHDFKNAIAYFDQALPKRNQEHASWYLETLYYLGWSHLKIVDEENGDPERQLSHLEKAKVAFKGIIDNTPDEHAYLALGQCYLKQANLYDDVEAYKQAEDLLSKHERFPSHEADALILRAEAAPTYQERQKLYRQLTHESNSDSPSYGHGWYFRGLNELQEGRAKIGTREAKKAFDHAVTSFEQAFALLQDEDPQLAGLARRYQVEAYHQLNTEEASRKALALLERLGEDPFILENPDEIFYLQGIVAADLGDTTKSEQALHYCVKEFPEGRHADQALLFLGTLSYQNGDIALAKEHFLKLPRVYPASPYGGEALLLASHCTEDEEEAKRLRRQSYETYPESPFAAEAYFFYYPYRDYLHGDRAAIKHIRAMEETFPYSPYTIHALYLIGLDNKRDRKSAEGKWIRKRNLTAAIDAFHEAELTFNRLNEMGGIPLEEQERYYTIRYRATLERALANLSIARESQGAKRQIYLEYAEEVFAQLLQDFEDGKHPFFMKEQYPKIQEESAFWLAKTYLLANQHENVERVFSEMLEKYQSCKVTRGYYLSRVRYEEGRLAMRNGDYLLALEQFRLSEDAAKGKVLSADEKLDLWIQQSSCYRAMGDWDRAMLILSDAINDDAVSGLRIKAMVLRAEIYAEQGRHELARRQLEAASLKGGEWGLKATIKLDEQYGYQ